jgi:DNA-binding CsgD family transcriptional regulator
LQSRRGSFMLVEGTAGSGKTHLVNVAAREARQRGVSILRVTPDTDTSSTLPRRTGAERQRPQLVLADDVHHFPADTLERLVELLVSEPANPVAVLVTLRSRRSAQGLDRLLDTTQPGLVRLVLKPLPQDAVIQLVTDLLGAPPEDALLDCVAAAAGDPRLTRALVEGLREEGRIHQGGHQAGLAAGEDRQRGALPSRVHDTVRRLLDEVTAQCRQLLCTAAVLGPAVDPDKAAEMLGQSTAALLPVWEEALSSGVLRQDQGRVVFTHELMRRAVAESLPAAIRSALIEQFRALDPTRSGDPDDGAAERSVGRQLLIAEDASDAPRVRLTQREQMVLSLLAGGRSNQQIARALGLSIHAVKRHVSNLLIKFDCTNRTEVALAAAQMQHNPVQGDPRAWRTSA